MSSMPRQARPDLLLFVTVLVASNLTACKMPGPVEQVVNLISWAESEPPEPVPELSDSRIHAEQTAFVLSVTQDALEGILLAQEAATVPAVNSHPPVIKTVVFPDRLPADGTTGKGTIIFTDAGHDVIQISLLTLAGTFGTGSWDPSASITWTDGEGSLPFGGKCGRVESVRATVTLTDAAGSSSAPAEINFVCQ